METGDPSRWELGCRGEVLREWKLTLIQAADVIQIPRMVEVVHDIERRIWTIEEHADVNGLEDKGKGREAGGDEPTDEGMDEPPRDKGKGRAVDVEEGNRVDEGLNDPPVSFCYFPFYLALISFRFSAYGAFVSEASAVVALDSCQIRSV